jgi:hypothetical protein
MSENEPKQVKTVMPKSTTVALLLEEPELPLVSLAKDGWHTRGTEEVPRGKKQAENPYKKNLSVRRGGHVTQPTERPYNH